MDRIINKLVAVIIILTAVMVMAFAAMLDKEIRYEHLVGRQVGPWNGRIVDTVREYKGEYAVNAILDEGSGLLLTNELKDMFDVPQETNVQFWGTIESFRPLIIHVDGIGW